MRLVLIRHGESEHSRRGHIAGPGSCPGLTPGGREQVRRLAARLAATQELADATFLLSSSAARARETAEALTSAFPGVPSLHDPDLFEVHVGAADGLSWDAYRAAYGSFDLIAEPHRPFAPGGESWALFLARVRATLDRLAAAHAGQTVVAVTHAGFIVATVLVAFAIPRPGTGARLEPANTALTEWRVDAGVWQLVRYNDAAHLLVADAPRAALHGP